MLALFALAASCVEGIYRIMRSDYPHPLNLGTDELVTINELVNTVAEIAGKRITKWHDTSKPQGVRGRNSDNTRIHQVLGWGPRITLREGLEPTYRWIESELKGRHAHLSSLSLP
jgi:nucleoside-diphosphate-sugar epimerase